MTRALKYNGEAWGWGDNNYFGEIGDNTKTNRSSPVSVVGAHKFISVSGTSTKTALKVDGSCWGWGDNVYSNGGIGDYTQDDKSSPVSVVGAHKFIQVRISCGLKSNGEVWCWGNNGYGQLGDNTRTAKSSPVLVVGSHNFTWLGGKEGTTSGALKTNGEAWTWGSGTEGRLGDNSTTSKSSPVSVVGNHAFTYLYVGASACAALKSNGECWTWGHNGSGASDMGQLGDGTITDRSSPVSVVGNHAFIKVLVRQGFMLALKADGSCWTWGVNSVGQLGNQTTTDKSSPVSVVGNHTFVDILDNNVNSSGALKSNGELWAWGYGDSGVLGDGTITNKSSPVLVVGSHTFAPQPLSFLIDYTKDEGADYYIDPPGQLTIKLSDQEIAATLNNDSLYASQTLSNPTNGAAFEFSITCPSKDAFTVTWKGKCVKFAVELYVYNHDTTTWDPLSDAEYPITEDSYLSTPIFVNSTDAQKYYDANNKVSFLVINHYMD